MFCQAVSQFTIELAVDSCSGASTNAKDLLDSLFPVKGERTISVGRIHVGLGWHDAFPCKVIVTMVIGTSNEDESAVEGTI